TRRATAANGMKLLLNGAAIAAALGMAVPAWAQAPMTPATGAKPAAAAPAPGAAAAAPAKQRHMRKPMRMSKRGGGSGMARSGDASNEQLNREELARIQGPA